MNRGIYGISITVLLLIIANTACAGEKAGGSSSIGYPLAQLQEDFDQYVRLIRRDHPMTFTDRTVLDRTIAAQRRQLRDGMSETEFLSVIAPVGAAVRCGHTRTYLSREGRERLDAHGRCLPLDVRVMGSDLYVFKDFTADETIARGSRVLSINSNAAAAIIARMRASRYADGTNITYKDYGINLFFAELFTILYGGTPEFELEIIEPGAVEPVTRRVAAITPNRADQVNAERYSAMADCDRLCMTVSDDNAYAVLTIKDFGYYDNVDAFRKPVGEFFARIKKERIGALIIDVRGNDGGDPYCSSFVVSHVITEPVRYFAAGTPFYDDLVKPIPVPADVFDGELFVLTDGWCFSSTGHMLSLLRCHQRGVFIGQESGGSTACNDASKEHVLEHTGLRLNLPRRAFATSARCLPPGRGIPPDIDVEPTIDDLITERDVVLEKAVSVIEP